MKSTARSLRSLVALTLALVVAPGDAQAGGTRTFHVADFDDFDSGEVEGAAIEQSGKVTVGFTAFRSGIEATSVFSCATVKGGDIYVGTADPAAIWRVGEAKPKKRAKPSKLAAGDKPSKKGEDDDAKKPDELAKVKIADLPGVVVSALVELPGGDLLAATLPGGVIHRVSPKGKVSEFAKLDVETIWALQVHRGRLYVGTGPKGELYTLDLSGKDPKLVLDVDEKNILSLQPVGDAMVAGTSPRAKLFQVTDDLEGTLLHDFEGDEIRSLALTGGGLLAAVNEFDDRGLSSLKALTKGLARTSLIGQAPEGEVEKGDAEVKANAKLYHVALGTKLDPGRAEEATWEVWLSKKKQYFTSVVAADMAGTALVSSSYKGKVYRVRGRRDAATVATLEERQATALCPRTTSQSDKRVVATTGDGAAVYELQPGDLRTPARYRSEIFDADQPARFGAIHVRGRGPFVLRARVGPSDEPDARWSEWRKIPVKREDDALRGVLNLPVRRYLQLEFALEDPVAELREITAYYAPENLAPLLSEVDVSRPEFEAEDDDEPKPQVTIKWKAEAVDDDELVYRVKIRPEGGGDGQWIALDDEPTTKKEYKWEIDSVPDGTYEIGVTASDEPTNGVTRARTDELVSSAFTIDRKRPTIDGVKVDGRKVTGTARDEGSLVHDVSFSVNAGPFRAASAGDGLYDSKVEGFSLELPAELERGRHRLVLRARDDFGNMASVAVIVDIK